MTQIVNIFGSAGAGKSTLALGSCYELKMEGFKVEYVSEYAKGVVWEESFKKLDYQYYIFAKQLKSIDVLLNRGLDYIVTDSPLLLSLFYGQKYGTLIPHLPSMIITQHKAKNNINFFLERTHPFEEMGRMQTALESDKDSEDLRRLFRGIGENCIDIKSSKTAAKTLAEEVLKRRV